MMGRAYSASILISFPLITSAQSSVRTAKRSLLAQIHPPERFLIVLHPSVQALPVAALQLLQTLLGAKRRSVQQPDNLQGHVGDQVEPFDRAEVVEATALDVMVDLEVGLFVSRRIEGHSLLDTMQSKLTDVRVTIDCTDQVADEMARDQANRANA
jgi:hypothetical protein